MFIFTEAQGMYSTRYGKSAPDMSKKDVLDELEFSLNHLHDEITRKDDELYKLHSDAEFIDNTVANIKTLLGI